MPAALTPWTDIEPDASTVIPKLYPRKFGVEYGNGAERESA